MFECAKGCEEVFHRRIGWLQKWSGFVLLDVKKWIYWSV